MAHFYNCLKPLNAQSEGGGSAGSVRLWFPYIEMNYERRISDAILRLPTKEFSDADQELFYVFFHEYIHIVQSVLFPVCQYPLTLHGSFL